MTTLDIHSLMARTRMLVAVPAFKGVDYDALVCIAKAAREEKFDVGKVVIEENDPGSRLYVVMSGQAEASCKTSKGLLALALFGQGDMFGEVALVIPNSTRTATITAKTPLVVISFSAEDMNHLMSEHPNLRRALEVTARRVLLASFIKKFSPFSTMDPGRVATLAEKIKTITVQPNTVIIAQGERGNYCYMLKSGSVDVILKSEGAERVLNTLYPGAIFGEVSLLAGTLRGTGVRSREHSEMYAIGKQDFLGLVENDHQVSAYVMDLLQLRDRLSRKKNVSVQVITRAGREEEFVLKAPDLGRYYRLSTHGKFIWDRLDGTRTLRDLTVAYFDTFKTVSPQAIAELVGGLGKAGFLESAVWSAQVQRTLNRVPFFARAFERVRSALERVTIRRHVDPWFTQWYRRVSPLFSRPALWLWGVLAVGGIAAFARVTPRVLPFLSDYVSWRYAAWIALPLVLSFMFHEWVRGLAVKYFGREVMGVGMGWYWITPIVFVDTSDMWLATRRQRMATSLAGPFVLVLIAGIAVLTIYGAGVLAVHGGASVQPGAAWLYAYYPNVWGFAAASYAVATIMLLPIKGTDGYDVLQELKGDLPKN